MSGWIKFFCFLLALPAVAAIGFDAYMAYVDIEAGNSTQFSPEAPAPFKLTQIGWILQTYSPGSFSWLKETTSPEVWKNIITPILKSYAVILTCGIAGGTYITLFICSRLGIWPFNESPGLFSKGSKEKEDSFAFESDLSNKKKGPMKYKRK